MGRLPVGDDDLLMQQKTPWKPVRHKAARISENSDVIP